MMYLFCDMLINVLFSDEPEAKRSPFVQDRMCFTCYNPHFGAQF